MRLDEAANIDAHAVIDVGFDSLTQWTFQNAVVATLGIAVQ
jgi:hypothetical protein